MADLLNPHRALGSEFAQAHERIRAAVGQESDQYVRGADAGEWAAHLADVYRRSPPTLLDGQPQWEDLGESTMDVRGLPGIGMSSAEMFGGKPAWRPSRRFKVTVSIGGDAQLLAFGPPGRGSALAGTLDGNQVVRAWEWPLEKGHQGLEAEVAAWFASLKAGVQAVAQAVESYNAGLTAVAEEAITERRRKIEAQDTFLSSMSVPVRPREDAPRPFALPPIEVRETPAAKVISPKPQPVAGPTLGELYDHILEVIRAMGRALERTPEEFSSMEEERVRDILHIILNTHYRGQTYAEAFNKNGKTDVLIRVQDKTLFIGECKWWGGPAEMTKALEQLYGYTTWRDSRLALLFFVRNRDATAIVEKARRELGTRAEFDRWLPTTEDRELRCQINWPGDPDRAAILTLLFFHLPAQPSVARHQ